VWRSTIQAAADEIRARPFDLLIADAAFALSGRLQDEGRPRNPLTPTILIGDASAEQHVGLSGRTMYMTPPVDHAMLTCFERWRYCKISRFVDPCGNPSTRIRPS
jgi:hypothetical protein